MGITFSAETVRRALAAFPEVERVDEAWFDADYGGMSFRVCARACSCWIKIKISEAMCLDVGTFVEFVRRAVRGHQCLVSDTELFLQKENKRAALMAYVSSPISYDAEDWLTKNWSTNAAPETPAPSARPSNEQTKRFSELDFDDKEPNE